MRFEIVADQLQLGVARAGVDERVEKLREVAHDGLGTLLYACLVAFGLLLTGWAYWTAIADPVVREAEVALPGWPAGAAPVRAVLISDLHVAGPDMPPARLARIVAQVNALRPDLVLIAGDFISDKRASTRHYSQAEAAAPLAGLRARLGIDRGARQSRSLARRRRRARRAGGGARPAARQ